MSLTFRAGLACAVLLGLTPPAAAAATFNVDPTGASGAYRTIGAAVAAAGPGDTIAVAAGDYPEDVVVPAGRDGLAITGVDGARLLGATSSTADVLTIRSPDVKVTTLAIQVPAGAGSGVRVDEGASTVLTGLPIAREAGASPDPLVDVAGGADISRSFLLQQAGAAGTPALASTGASGVRLLQSAVVSAVGPALTVSASDANVLRRSTLATTQPTSDAVQVLAGSAGARALTADASFVIGGAQAAGVRVVTHGAPAADVTTLLLRHVTVHGAARGLVLDAAVPTVFGVPVGTAGSISAAVLGSIVHEPSFARGQEQTAVLPENTVSVRFEISDTPGIPPADRGPRVDYTEAGLRFTPEPSKLFGRDLHLRADSPAIDAGSVEAPAEELRMDIDGQGRPIGAATDLGADEFLNVAPTARLDVSPAAPAEGEAVTFTSTVNDPNVGDTVAGYAWDFGDGTATQSTIPAVSHAYEEAGTYTAKLAVVDARGLVSPLATATVTVRDTRPPAVSITTPRPGTTLTLNRPGRTPRRLVVKGTTRDASGVGRVDVALTRRSGASCRHYTRRGLRTGPCDAYRWRKAKLVGDAFKLVTRRGLALMPGRYELRARGTDLGGRTGTTFSRASRSLVRVRVR